jgi:hypothetical protein
MRALVLSVAMLGAMAGYAFADPAGAPRVVTTCGAMSPFPTQGAGQSGSQTVDTNGNLCGATSGGGTITATPTKGTGAYTSATVGTTDSTILAASTAVVFLDVVNTSPSATICVNVGATATISGTACAAGEVSLPPLWHRSWEGTFIPTDAIHAIASAASTPATVGAK